MGLLASVAFLLSDAAEGAVIFPGDFPGIIVLDGDISDFFHTNGLPLPGVRVVNDDAPLIPGVPNSQGLGGFAGDLGEPNYNYIQLDPTTKHPTGFNQRRIMSAFNPNIDGGTLFIGIDLPGGTGSAANSDYVDGFIVRGSIRPFDADGNGEPDSIGRRSDGFTPLYRCSDALAGDWTDIWDCNLAEARNVSDQPRGEFAHSEFYSVKVKFGGGQEVIVAFAEKHDTPPDLAELAVVSALPVGARVSSSTGGTGVPLGFDVEFAITNLNAAVPDEVERRQYGINVRAVDSVLNYDTAFLSVDYNQAPTNLFSGTITLDGDISDFFLTNGFPKPGVLVSNDNGGAPLIDPNTGIPVPFSEGLAGGANEPNAVVMQNNQNVKHPSGFNQKRIISAFNPNLDGGTLFIGLDLPGGYTSPDPRSVANPNYSDPPGLSPTMTVRGGIIRPFDADGNGEPDSIGRKGGGGPDRPLETIAEFDPGDSSDIWNPFVLGTAGLSDQPRGSFPDAEFYSVTVTFGGGQRVNVVFTEKYNSAPGMADLLMLSALPFGARVSSSTGGTGAPLGFDVEFAITNVNAAVPNLSDRMRHTVVAQSGSTVGFAGVHDIIARTSPFIRVPPVSTDVPAGSTVTFTVDATGSRPFNYQWRLNGVNIPGATNPTLTLTNIQRADGGSYSVVVANDFAADVSKPGVLIVNMPVLPFSDMFAGRFATNNTLSGFGRGLNYSATSEPGEPNHAGKTGGKSLWFAWRPPATGLAVIDTRGSSFDTLLAVYTNTVVRDTNQVAADEDSGGNLTSLVTFNVQAGTEYQIAIDGYFGATGNVVLAWNLLSVANEIPLILAGPQSQSTSPGSNVTFSVSAVSQSPLTYQWFQNGIAIAGAINDTLTVTNVQESSLGQYWVCVGNAATNVESARAVLEIGAVVNFTSEDKLEDFLVPGRNQNGLLAGWLGLPELKSPSAVGAGIIELRSFLSVSAGIPYSQTINNFGATTQPCEPTGGVLGGASRWMRLKAEGTGIMVVDTIGSRLRTSVSAYVGTNLCDPLTYFNQVAVKDSNSGPGGSNSLIRFPAVDGTTYAIQMDTPAGEQGIVKVNWFLCPPAGSTIVGAEQAVKVGEKVILCAAAYAATTRYQWLLNGTPLSGETNATLILASFGAAFRGDYSMVASNAAEITTNLVANLHVLELGSVTRTTNGLIRFQLTGEPEARYVLEISTNLSSHSWQPLSTNTATTNGLFNYIATNSPGHQPLIYRAKQMR